MVSMIVLETTVIAAFFDTNKSERAGCDTSTVVDSYAAFECARDYLFTTCK